MTNRLLIQAWKVIKVEERYYIPYTHWIYLAEITKYFEKICLIAPTKEESEFDKEGFYPLDDFDSVVIEEVSLHGSYISAGKFFFEYLQTYRKLSKEYDTSYVRFPSPWGWLSKLFFKNKKRIIHFVGDPIDVTKNNPNLSSIKKKLLINFFKPEFRAYIWACKGAEVYTNGYHIAKKLERYDVKAKPLISSTLKIEDINSDFEQKDISALKLLYVGYLRKAKGVKVVIQAFRKVLNDYPQATLTLVGDGEYKRDLERFVINEKIIEKVTFAGHIDDREQLNRYYQTHDIFLFASYSEGSPRVVLEAMANSLPVISTPVGSLPYIFENGKDIVFADFGDADAFYKEIKTLADDTEKMVDLKKNALVKAKEFTIERFIKTIFSE